MFASIRRVMLLLVPVILAAIVLIGSSNRNTGKAAYTADGSKLLWFMQLSDTHVSTWFNQWYDDNLLWALGEGVDTIDPWFVVTTGDLTDSTAGINYLGGPQIEEWQEYRGYLEQSEMTPRFYFDVPGNHDAYSDGPLSYYLAHSYAGKSYNTTQAWWKVRMSWGDYNFFATSTPDNGGPPWPGDNSILTDAELQELENNMELLGEAEFSMAFGHHPITGVRGVDDLVELMKRFDIFQYACGHSHDFVIRYDYDWLMQYRIDSLGQSNLRNVGIYAIDNNTLSVGVTSTDDPWPAAIVTAPVAAVLESYQGDPTDNPYAPVVPGDCILAPVRVLAFDVSGIASVRMRIDGGAWQDMNQRINVPEQWRGYFDASGLSSGVHGLEIEVSGSNVKTFASNFYVEDGVCDIGEEDEDLPLEEGEIITADYESDGDETDGDAIETDGDPIDPDGDEVDPDCDEFDPDGDEALLDGDKVGPDGDANQPECKPGETSCLNEEIVLICSAEGRWERMNECGKDWFCQKGECRQESDDIASDGDEETDISADGTPAASFGSGGGCSQAKGSSVLGLWILVLLLMVGRRKKSPTSLAGR